MSVANIRVKWIPPLEVFPPPSTAVEQYGTGTHAAGDTSLHWILFRHNDVARPMVLVVHIGEFKYGQPGPQAVARDFYYAGYNAACIQHRLADPGHEMRTAPYGDQPVDDHGLYPEQPTDLSTAIIAARTGSTPRTSGIVTGQVAAIGGSAGGTQVLHMAADTLAGSDKLDCAVSLSAATAFADPASWPPARGTDFGSDVHNYVGCTAGDPACDNTGGLLDLASPYRRFSATSAPVRFYASSNDPMPPNQYTILKNTLDSVGAPYETRLLTEAAYQDNGATRHAFQYWYPIDPTWPDSVKDESIAFVQGIMPPP